MIFSLHPFLPSHDNDSPGFPFILLPHPILIPPRRRARGGGGAFQCPNSPEFPAGAAGGGGGRRPLSSSRSGMRLAGLTRGVPRSARNFLEVSQELPVAAGEGHVFSPTTTTRGEGEATCRPVTAAGLTAEEGRGSARGQLGKRSGPESAAPGGLAGACVKRGRGGGSG